MYKILVTIDWFYPGFRAGGPITSMWNLINNLSQDFEFYVLTSNHDYGGVRLNVKENQWVQVKENLSVCYCSKLSQVLRQLRSFTADLVMVNGIYSYRFSILPALLKRKSRRVIFPRGMLSQHSLSVKSWRKRIFLLLAKAIGLYSGAVFFTNSQQEFDDIRRIFPRNKVELIPNLVSPEVIFRPIEKRSGNLRLITVSRISPVKNLEFAVRVFQYKFNGEIVWHIYGPVENKRYLQKLQDLIENLPQNVHVKIFPPISPFQVKEYISKYHFFYLPTLGENFGHSIFEAFASSRPVITSNTTPWRNLESKSLGWDLELDLKNFRRVIQKAIDMGQEKFDRMCKNARNFARDFTVKQKKDILNIKNSILKIINKTL